jgi:hypothetical protein
MRALELMNEKYFNQEKISFQKEFEDYLLQKLESSSAAIYRNAVINFVNKLPAPLELLSFEQLDQAFKQEALTKQNQLSNAWRLFAAFLLNKGIQIPSFHLLITPEVSLVIFTIMKMMDCSVREMRTVKFSHLKRLNSGSVVLRIPGSRPRGASTALVACFHFLRRWAYPVKSITEHSLVLPKAYDSEKAMPSRVISQCLIEGQKQIDACAQKNQLRRITINEHIVIYLTLEGTKPNYTQCFPSNFANCMEEIHTSPPVIAWLNRIEPEPDTNSFAS